MTSFTRKNTLSAEMSADKARPQMPFRYDRLLVFLLLLAASALILSQALLERRVTPVVGEIVENDVFAPRGFVYFDTPTAEAKWQAEFDRLPTPYIFDQTGFEESARKLRKYFISDREDSSPASLFMSDPRRLGLALERVGALIEKARTMGLLQKSYETERMLSVIDREGGERIVNSSRILQPGNWEKYLQGLNEDEIIRVSGLLDKYLQPTLKFNEARAAKIFDDLKRRYPAQPMTFSTERPVVTVGQELDERHADILRQLDRFSAERNYIMIMALIGILVLTLSFGALYLKKYMPAMYDRVRDVSAISFAFGMVLLLCLLVWIAIGFNFGVVKFSNAAMPVATAAMLLTLLYGAPMAFIFSMLAGILIAAVTAPRLVLLVMFIFGSMTGAITAASARKRSDLIRSGLLVAVVQLAVVVLLGMLHGEPFMSVRIDMISAIVSGLFSAFFAQALLLPLEAISHRTSSFTLLELGDLNHPLLQLLLRKAPGTFQHSQHVALLAQSAAEAIGANALLARIGAYFHDIGKMRKPEYFTENQGPGENPHDKLRPSLSASVIKAHVLDGIIMAQEERLPDAVIAFIAQHHGTAVIGIFYHRALEAAGEEVQVNRGDFQYPGPKPQTPETGIVMLADRVEATSRAMSKPTANKLERMVKKTITEIFESGELDECELTFKDITVISREFMHVLCGIHHMRKTEYPDAEEIADAEKKSKN